MQIIMKKTIFIILGIASGIVIFELVLSFIPGYNFDSMACNTYTTSHKDSHMFCYRSSKLMGYELVPNIRKNINSLGMRDREYSFSKPEGVFRILVLGDSTTAQLGIKNRWADVLEDKLNSHGKYEVLNAAVSGYNLYHYWAYLMNKGMELDPDLVITAFCLNDIESWDCVRTILIDKNVGIHFSVSNRNGKLMMQPTLDINPWLYRRSFLYRFIVTRSLDRKERDTGMPQKMLSEMRSITGNNIAAVIFPYLKPLNNYTAKELMEYNTTVGVLDTLGIDYLDLHQYSTRDLIDIKNSRTTKDDFIHFGDNTSIYFADIIHKWLTDRTQ